MVVDSSALLAVLFDEPAFDFVAKELDAHAGHLVMSTVNLTEVLIILRDRRRGTFEVLEDRVRSMGIRFVAPDVKQAEIAAAARLRFPLNLGDCFAYALAVVERRPLLTLDADFRALDCEVVMPDERRAG